MGHVMSSVATAAHSLSTLHVHVPSLTTQALIADLSDLEAQNNELPTAYKHETKY
jgi:hypothetical protein